MTDTDMDLTEDMSPYSHSAVWYNTLYEELKDYAAEATAVMQIVRRYVVEDNPSLLDVACGTGLHLSHLLPYCGQVAGLDMSEQQLEAARQRMPDVNFIQADMREFRLSRPGFLGYDPAFYDVVTCLFSSIGYMRDVEQLQQAIQSMAYHLHRGGVIIVEPWLTPETYDEGKLHGDNIVKENLRLSRMNISEVIREPGLPPRARMEMHYLVGTPDGIERFIEVHELTLFTREQYFEAFKAAGLKAEFDPNGLSSNGRGVFVATKSG